jgi:hypothetical protein
MEMEPDITLSELRDRLSAKGIAISRQSINDTLHALGYGPRGNAVLRKLQPYKEAISWPARPIMNDKDAHAISNAFFNRVTSIDIAKWRASG